MTTSIEITIDDDDDEVVPTANANSNNNPILKCAFCTYETKAGDATLKTHILALHQNAAPKPGGTTRNFQCPFCSFSATQKINLHNHIVASHQINSKPSNQSNSKIPVQKSIPFQTIHKPPVNGGVQNVPKMSLLAKQQKVVPAKMPNRTAGALNGNHTTPQSIIKTNITAPISITKLKQNTPILTKPNQTTPLNIARVNQTSSINITRVNQITPQNISKAQNQYLKIQKPIHPASTTLQNGKPSSVILQNGKHVSTIQQNGKPTITTLPNGTRIVTNGISNQNKNIQYIQNGIHRTAPIPQNTYTKPKKEKRKMPPRDPSSNNMSGILKPHKLSEDLYALVGQFEASRSGCIKELWAYIKRHDLQDPENRRFIIPDEKMAKVFGKERFQSFTMSKYIGAHLSPLDKEMSRFSDLPLGDLPLVDNEDNGVKQPTSILPDKEDTSNVFKKANTVNPRVNGVDRDNRSKEDEIQLDDETKSVDEVDNNVELTEVVDSKENGGSFEVEESEEIDEVDGGGPEERDSEYNSLPLQDNEADVEFDEGTEIDISNKGDYGHDSLPMDDKDNENNDQGEEQIWADLPLEDDNSSDEPAAKLSKTESFDNSIFCGELPLF